MVPGIREAPARFVDARDGPLMEACVSRGSYAGRGTSGPAEFLMNPSPLLISLRPRWHLRVRKPLLQQRNSLWTARISSRFCLAKRRTARRISTFSLTDPIFKPREPAVGRFMSLDGIFLDTPRLLDSKRTSFWRSRNYMT